MMVNQCIISGRKRFLLVLPFLFIAFNSHAGTAGMSGSWDFYGDISGYDPSGVYVGSYGLVGNLDFDTGDVSLFQPFWDPVYISVACSSLSDVGDGTYTCDNATQEWGASQFNVDFLWEITDNGDNTASLIELDGDGDGIPGTKVDNGPFPLFSFAINGTLTNTSPVPVPAAVWLFGSGLIGLFAWARRK